MQLSVNGADTFIATGGKPFDPQLAAVPIRLRPETLSGCRTDVSSAISDPMEWPTSFAFGAPAASISAAVQSAMSDIVGSALPDERP